MLIVPATASATLVRACLAPVRARPRAHVAANFDNFRAR